MTALFDQARKHYQTLHSARQLRPYQMDIALSREQAIIEAQDGDGPVIDQLELIARQGGKNEMDAQSTVRGLLKHGARRKRKGLPLAKAVKTAPSYRPGIEISKERFESVLADLPPAMAKTTTRNGVTSLMGLHAGIVFQSAGVDANKRGHTANLWLSVDECQDTSLAVYDSELAPMRSTTAAPAFFSGTMKSDQCLSNVLLQRLTALQEQDGRRRVFVYDWEAVAEHNARYGEFVQGERDRLGADNPVFLAEYCLVPMATVGRFFTDSDIDKLLSGEHKRGRLPGTVGQAILVGAVDFSGVEETPEDGLWDPARQKRRDSTVAGVGWLRFKKDEDGLHPVLQVVDLLWMVNENPVSTVDRLYEFLFVKYGCVAAVLDGSGVGDAPAAMLEQRHAGCEVLKSSATDVTRMGWNLLSMVKSKRLTLFADDGSRDRAEMVLQCRELRRVVRANQTLKWEAPTNQPLVNGVATAVHDDGPKMLGYLVEAGHRHLTSQKPIQAPREFVPWAEAQSQAYEGMVA